MISLVCNLAYLYIANLCDTAASQTHCRELRDAYFVRRGSEAAAQIPLHPVIFIFRLKNPGTFLVHLNGHSRSPKAF